MAVYKVPQDVEAEDKLIGPFGFRQFIYLLVAAGAGGLTYLFVSAPMPIPAFSVFTIPVAVFLVVLSLPLKKDQPMEIYLAAIVRFWFKPKKRTWRNGGIASGSTVVIDIPPAVNNNLVRDITEEQAVRQLGYLSKIVDTRGWAAKGVDLPPDEEFVYVSGEQANPANDAEDMLDRDNEVAKSFDSLLAKQQQVSRQKIMEQMKNKDTSTAQKQAPENNSNGKDKSPSPRRVDSETKDKNNDLPYARNYNASWGALSAGASDANEIKPKYNPYPKMHQQVLSPLDKIQLKTFDAAQATGQSPQNSTLNISGNADEPEAGLDKNEADKSMTSQVSPDIINLANNNDLSIQAIANEARRIQQKEDEVVINLH